MMICRTQITINLESLLPKRLQLHTATNYLNDMVIQPGPKSLGPAMCWCQKIILVNHTFICDTWGFPGRICLPWLWMKTAVFHHSPEAATLWKAWQGFNTQVAAGQPIEVQLVASDASVDFATQYNYFLQVISHSFTSWWFQPHLKNISQIGIIFPKDRGENKKHFSCHHPV